MMEKQQSTKRNYQIFLIICLVIVLIAAVASWFYFKMKETGIHFKPATRMSVSEWNEESLRGYFKQENGQTYYFRGGVAVTGWQTIDGDTYYFDEDGRMLKETMVDKNRYVDEDGKLVDAGDIIQYETKGLSDLEQILKEQIGSYHGTVSIYVKNLDTNEYFIIHDEEIKSASLVKLYNMATVYDEMEKGNLKKDDTLSNNLNNMITVSDNGAYNRLLTTIGQGNVLEGTKIITKFCEDNGYKNTGCGSTLSSAESGCRPVWVFTNYTSSRDCGRLLEQIYRGSLVSEEASEEMLDMLKHQQWRAKIPAGLPEGVVCANKTGEYGNRQHDAAIVYSDGADYILVVMTEGDSASIGHIGSISKTVYQYFNEK